MTAAIITRFRDIRDSYAQRRALWRELSTYTTPGELSDLEAALARNEDSVSDPETEEIRRFISTQRSFAGHN